eukprot:PITA_15772
MDLAFANEKDVFLVVYLDDLMVFSKSDKEHMHHLKIVFQKCRKYGLSLNPKKRLFAVEEGKLLGNIILKDGIRIDPAHIQAIQQIDLPRNKKEIQSFNAPVLVSPDYTQDFIVFSFASEHTMAVVLLQKRDGHEIPIAFFRRAIRDAALKYNIIEKQALALVKALKDFRIKPTKLIKGQELVKLMAELNLHALDINLIAALTDENEQGTSIQVSEMFSLSPWYSNIIYVLTNLSPPLGMTRNKARTLKLKAAKFCILNSALYWKDPDGILLNCLVEEEAKKAMEDFHGGECGGHLFWKSTTNKILRAGYYWPTLFADVHKMVKPYRKCQIFEGKQKLQPLPLKPIEVSTPFQ